MLDFDRRKGGTGDKFHMREQENGGPGLVNIRCINRKNRNGEEPEGREGRHDSPNYAL